MLYRVLQQFPNLSGEAYPERIHLACIIPAITCDIVLQATSNSGSYFADGKLL